MSKAISTILFILLYTHGIQADQPKQADSMPDHIKGDLALLQSFEAYSQTQSAQALLGSFLTVGGDPDQNWCDFSTLQAAINDAARKGITEIRIAYNKTYYENLTIDDISISLIGGYASCQLAGGPFSAPSNNQVRIDGGGKDSVVKISGASRRNTILLKNLSLSNGSGTQVDTGGFFSIYGGGIVADKANALVTLKNVDVKNNSAQWGGGIAIIYGDTDMLLLDSRVLFNSATIAGGGISCHGGSDAGSSIVVANNSGVLLNEAAPDGGGSGGGVYVERCHFSLYSGTATGGPVGVFNNRAGYWGGGIYADQASVALNGQQYCPANGACLGDNINPASIRGNVAGLTDVDSDFLRSGGGIFAGDSSVTINAGYIEGNTGFIGGGILLNRSNLTVERIAKPCWDNQRCNLFLGNWAEKEGGAIYGRSTNMDISASYFEENHAPIGSAIFVEGDSSFTRIEGSVFNHNGSSSSESVFRVKGGEGLEIVHSTIADNTISTEIYGAAIIQMLYQNRVPSLAIHSSILDNSGHENLYHTMLRYAARLSCIITNDVVSLSSENELANPIEDLPGGARILKTNPGFANRDNRDYRLVAGSAAIDYCHTPTYTEVKFKDIEFQERGVDDPNHDDNYFLSFYDIGADEAYVGPLIFKNSFE